MVSLCPIYPTIPHIRFFPKIPHIVVLKSKEDHPFTPPCEGGVKGWLKVSTAFYSIVIGCKIFRDIIMLDEYDCQYKSSFDSNLWL